MKTIVDFCKAYLRIKPKILFYGCNITLHIALHTALHIQEKFLIAINKDFLTGLNEFVKVDRRKYTKICIS